MTVAQTPLVVRFRVVADPDRRNPTLDEGGVVAAIDLAVHRSLVSMEDLVLPLSPALKRTAAEISARIGYRPAPA
jgi:hypothetical protein